MTVTRQPRLLVLVDGAVLPGVLAVELDGCGALQADRFRVQAALGAGGLTPWTPGAPIDLDVRLSLDGGQSFTPMLVGQVDQIYADPIRGVVSFTGRDLSARLIDRYSNDGYDNQTASDVATMLANRRGLTPAVSGTSVLVGRYYGGDHAQIALGRAAHARSEWDVLAGLAQHEGFALYVSGQTLYFAPPSDPPPFVVAWRQDDGAANVSALRLSWAPAIAGGVQVDVQSWHSGQGAMVSGSAGPAGGLLCRVVRPNLTGDAASTLAVRLQAQFEGQQRQIAFDMPGELTLTPRSLVQLSGDVAGWAGLYRVVRVARHLDQRRGFQQSVTARGCD